MSSTFTALIWWLIPLTGLIGALSYVLWVSKYQGKFEQETTRSVSSFQKFQNSFRDPQAKKNRLEVDETKQSVDPTESN